MRKISPYEKGFLKIYIEYCDILNLPKYLLGIYFLIHEDNFTHIVNPLCDSKL